MNDLYYHELRLYKNFFQPVMKLQSKERIGGRVKRKYDVPRTSYQRLMESEQISEKEELHRIYLSLNPAELKREKMPNWKSYTRFMRKRGKPNRLTLTRS